MQALTPAMEGWKKRIGRIATNFEAANKDAIQPQQQDGQQGSRQASLSSLCILPLFPSDMGPKVGSCMTVSEHIFNSYAQKHFPPSAGSSKSRWGREGAAAHRRRVQPTLGVDKLPGSRRCGCPEWRCGVPERQGGGWQRGGRGRRGAQANG